MSIHPTALVDSSAVLGRDVEIGPFAIVEGQVEIGDGCVIGPRASVLAHTTLGAGCRVHTGAVLGDLPQDLAFTNEPSYVRIGNYCVIREYVTIHRGTKPGSVTTMGDHCFLMANAHLAHNAKLGDHVILANGALIAGYAEVGDRAFISGNVAVHQFVRIGRLAMMGGGSGVSKDVPPFCLVPGLTANRVACLNLVGMKRAGFTPEQRQQAKDAFRILYRDGLTVTDAVAAIRTAFPEPGPAQEMADFTAHSKRGICRFGLRDEGEAAI
jgi:UDP-N-acetylglucosamine acyltransferase